MHIDLFQPNEETVLVSCSLLLKQALGLVSLSADTASPETRADVWAVELTRRL
jgi:hypothetical protein